MTKRILLTLACIFFAFTAHATQYTYRGVFRSDRKPTAHISYYVLLQSGTQVRFTLEDRDAVLTDKIIVSRVFLTSDKAIELSNTDGIILFEPPQTGIFEVIIEPTRQSAEEINFVLKITELKEDSIQENSQAENPSTLLPYALLDTNVEIKDDSEHSQTVTNLYVSQKDEDKTHPVEQALDVAPQTHQDNLPLNLEKTLDKIIDENLDEITIEAPLAGFYINPLSGFSFTGNNIHLLSTKEIFEKFSIYRKGKNNQKLLVYGNYFSIAENSLNFLPDEILPGAVYYIETTANDNLPVVASFSAFPELNLSYKSLPNALELNITWKQIQEQELTPLSQLLSLDNVIISLFDADTLIAEITTNKPMSVFNRVIYRATPFMIQLTLPQSVLSSILDILVEIKAPIDGQSDLSTVFVDSIALDKIINQTELITKDTVSLETDFSMVRAIETQADIDQSELLTPPPWEQQNFTPLQSLSHSATASFVNSFAIWQQDSEKNVAWPHQITWDERGYLWVLDSQSRKVLAFNPIGKLFRAFGKRGEEPGELAIPVAIIKAGAHIYVSESSAKKTYKYSEEGEFLKEILIESDTNKSLVPAAFALRKSELWVLDKNLDALACLDLDDNYLGSLKNEDTSLLNTCIDLKADEKGLFILEKSGLLKIIDPMGEQLAAFQTGIQEPTAFDLDPWGTIWIIDAIKKQIVRFSQTGQRLYELNSPDPRISWFPTSISVRSDGLIAVADAQNKTINIFRSK